MSNDLKTSYQVPAGGEEPSGQEKRESNISAHSPPPGCEQLPSCLKLLVAFPLLPPTQGSILCAKPSPPGEVAAGRDGGMEPLAACWVTGSPALWSRGQQSGSVSASLGWFAFGARWPCPAEGPGGSPWVTAGFPGPAGSRCAARPGQLPQPWRG